MTQSPRKELLKSVQKSSAEDADGWSTQELGAEIAQTTADLNAACLLERTAKRRHEKEKMLETEVAYEGRREEANRIRQRRDRLLQELHRRRRVRPL